VKKRDQKLKSKEKKKL